MATKYWLGSAAQVPQVWTLTVSGTWANGDHVILQTAGESRTEVRLDFNASGLTTANIADKIYRTISAASNDDSLLDDEVRSAGCQQIPEWTELSASYPGTGDVVTVTGLPGVYVELACTATTAGDGAVATAQVQAATGKWFWSDADNWSGGAVPASNDLVYFDNGSEASCMFGLPNETLEFATVYIQMGFSGRQLGLPSVNRHDYETGRPKPRDNWYPEWRQRGPVFDDAGSGTNPEFVIGQGSGSGPRYINIKQIDLPSKVMVHRTGPPLPHEQYVVEFNSDSAVNGTSFAINGGSVAIAPGGDAGRIEDLDVGRGATVYVGPFVQFINNATLTMNGGFVRCDTYSFGSGSVVTVLGGTLEISSGATSTTTLRVFHPGVCFYSGNKAAGTGTIAAAYISGTLSFARAIDGLDWSAVNPVQLMRGARILDPQRKVSWSSSNGLDLVGCGLGGVTLQFGQNITITKLANDP